MRTAYRLVLTLTLMLLSLSTNPYALAEMKSAEPSQDALRPKLDSMTARFKSHAPKEKFDLYQGSIDDLRKSGILESALNVGDTVPEFALPDALGDTVSLASLVADGPLVIVWYRGGWCPYCNLTLAAWKKELPVVKAEGARLVAISPEIPDSSLSTKEKHELEFTVLSDYGNALAHRCGIAFKLPPAIVKAYSEHFDLAEFNGDDRYELPLAATYIVGTDRVIRYAFLDADYKRRAEPADVIAALKMVTSE